MPDMFTGLDLGSGKWQRAWISSGATEMDTVSGGLADTVGTGFSKLIDIADLDSDGVIIMRQRYKEGYRFVKVSGGSHGVFRVDLAKTSGSAGNKTTPVSFLYSVLGLSGEAIATGKTPEWPSRSENGLKVQATSGLAYRDIYGNVQIAIAFERSGTGGCT